ncbi:hypothetical protein EMIT0111MI5_11263 [Burkholderia sp. IT-111MI5]
MPARIRATGLDAVIAPLMLTNVYTMAGSSSAALIVLLVLACWGRWRINGCETQRISLEECSTEGGAEPAAEPAADAAADAAARVS